MLLKFKLERLLFKDFLLFVINVFQSYLTPDYSAVPIGDTTKQRYGKKGKKVQHDLKRIPSANRKGESYGKDRLWFPRSIDKKDTVQHSGMRQIPA